MESGLITFFKVTESGFYRLKADENNPKKRVNVHVKGSLKETLTLVTKWAKDREFSQTIPWDIDANPNRTKVYCKDLCMDTETGDSLFVFCKATTNKDGSLSGFVENSKVGDESNDVVQVSKVVQGKKLIYALPMYYWFIPEHNLIASIKFPHSLASTSNVLEYIKRCIDNFIPTENKKITNSVGYNPALKQDINIKSVSYVSDCKKFSMKYKIDAITKELTMKDASLNELASDITHIVVRDTISSSKELETNDIFGLWNKITKKQGRIRQRNHVELVTEVDLDPASLANVLAVYDEENPIDIEWTNVGFRTNNDDTTKWFNSFIDRKHILLDPLLKRGDSYYPSKVLIDILKEERVSLLGFVNKEKQQVNSKIAVGET